MKINKRKVCVVTSSRADYGLLAPLLYEIKKDKGLELQLVVTGSHLSPKFGSTYSEIEKDGFKITKRIPILKFNDTPEGVVKAMGLVSTGFAEAFKELHPDLVLLMGDRFEMLNVVSAALIFCIPVVHLHGGEVTEGAFDDSIRHAITIMSHIHLVTTETYRKRVIQMGERPGSVFNVGEVGLDDLDKTKLLSKKALESTLKIKLSKRNLLVTFHPATLESKKAGFQFKQILKALDGLKDTTIIFTKTNADTNGSVINKMIDAYVKNRSNAHSFVSLGRYRYLSVMKYVDAVVGNSSSGIVEAPQMKIGTINVGNRQKGRVMANSIINCSADYSSIQVALRNLYQPGFIRKTKQMVSPYYKKHSTKLIKNIIKNLVLKDIIKKKFFDLAK